MDTSGSVCVYFTASRCFMYVLCRFWSFCRYCCFMILPEGKIQTFFCSWCFCCLLMSQFRWLVKKHWSSRILGLRFHICSMCPAQWGWNENWFFDKGTSSAAQWGSQFLQKTVMHHWNCKQTKSCDDWFMYEYSVYIYICKYIHQHQPYNL